MNICLKNQRILVTGASRGIGRAIAKQLSESGAEVIIHYNIHKSEADKLKSELQNSCFTESCDLSDASQVTGFIPRLVQKYGPLSALVNNAGISPGVAVVGPYQINSGQLSYYYLSGTSMASPHVAGIVALMAQKKPTLTAAEAETKLQSAAIPMAEGANAAGSGFITANAALNGL
jgi:NAD(P)-dependent dehydrogenase (short-subunit alcohol dehydrogenase family)